MNLQEKIELRDIQRDAIKQQEEVVSDCNRKMNLCRECARMLEDDADKWEAKLERERERLEEMTREHEALANEVYSEGVAQHGTFNEAFDCEKYFDGLKSLYKDGAFFQQPQV